MNEPASTQPPSMVISRPWWKKKRFVLPIGGFVALMALSPLFPADEVDTSAAEDLSTDVASGESPGSAVEPATTSTDKPTAQSATTQPTTTQAPTTQASTTTTTAASIPATTETSEACNGGGAQFDTVPGVACDEVFDEAERVMRTFDDLAGMERPFAELTTGVICTAAAGTEPITYEPESTYIPAVADALIGPLCPGDRAMLILNQ